MWSGILMVQKGPYQSAILRFQLRFPPQYPDVPPLLTFTTDIFHPLVVPLTTYTYTSSSAEAGTFSASDRSRPQAGSFSFKHGFPHWFGRYHGDAATAPAGVQLRGHAQRDDVTEETDRQPSTPSAALDEEPQSQQSPNESAVLAWPSTEGGNDDATSEFVEIPTPGINSRMPDVPVLSVLNYVRTTFDDANVLDSIPLEAAGNMGAWYAWRSHRQLDIRQAGHTEEEAGSMSTTAAGSPDTTGEMASGQPTTQTKPPREWNWEGVWEKRVKSCVDASFLESTLFGQASRTNPDDLIRFTKFDPDVLDGVKEQILSKQLHITGAH
ncbi:hypothetical protein KEM52_004323 [Ascosphaera acerosa]|nr:hypothetical protein KEM52_004323 [Ascosphaera acerosa]